MSPHGYRRLKTAIFIGPDSVRAGLVNSLESHGFRNVLQADSLEKFANLLRSTNLDLIISVTRFDNQFVGHVIRDLRLGLLDRSPFPVVLALLPGAEQDHVQAVINSGVDDLLLLPLSSDTLFKRIGQFTHERRPFVITHDYVGPDRRKNPRPGENSAPLVAVPNPVRSRMAGIDDSEIESAINDANLIVDRYKLRQDGLQLLWLLSRFKKWREEPDSEGVVPLPMFLRRCAEVCGDISRRAKENAERGIRVKSTQVKEVVDTVSAEGASPSATRLNDLSSIVEELVDQISAYHGEQLKL